jgi:hypothetical protein
MNTVMVDAVELAELRKTAAKERQRIRRRERRRAQVREEGEYYERMARMLHSTVNHAEDGGVTSLENLAHLSTLVDGYIVILVDFLRSEKGGKHSWIEVARALKISKAEAIRRYGGTEGARKPGGQPANLR